MIRLLTIFGVVEQRQMRLLFDHMSNRSYGQILARLRQEGLAYFSPDGQFLATSRYSLDHGKTQEAIMAFWAFIQMRDHVLDFCASEPPAILSFSSSDKDYDLISGSHLFGLCQFYRRNWLYYDRRIQRHCRILWYFQHSLYRNLPGHQD